LNAQVQGPLRKVLEKLPNIKWDPSLGGIKLREGKGREGKGREGKGREGKGPTCEYLNAQIQGP